jgi:hypothetical protein
VAFPLSFPALDHAAVLSGVQAKPSGWPSASLDTASGRLLLAAIENDAQDQSDRRLTEGGSAPAHGWVPERLRG